MGRDAFGRVNRRSWSKPGNTYHRIAERTGTNTGERAELAGSTAVAVGGITNEKQEITARFGGGGGGLGIDLLHTQSCGGLEYQDLRSSGRLSCTLDSPIWSRGGQAVGRCQPWRM